MTQKGKTADAVNGIALTSEQVEQILKQNESLIKRLDELEQQKQPLSFEERIELFQHQQQIIGHLNKFQETQKIISLASTTVKEKTESGDFEAKIYSLALNSTNGEKKSIFNITNPLIISKVLDSVLLEIDTKVEALKSELTF